MNTDLEVVRVEEVLSHDAGPSRSPCVGDLTPIVLMGSECHRLHVLCVGEPTLLLVAVAAALQTCVGVGGGVLSGKRFVRGYGWEEKDGEGVSLSVFKSVQQR